MSHRHAHGREGRREHRRRASRGRDGGFTLLEILVVLAIIALLAGAVAVGVIKYLDGARVTTTRQSALALRTAATGHRMQHPEDDCPTIDVLQREEAIDPASKVRDAWDQPFSLSCDERGAIRVASSGPDRKPGTADDVIVPDPANASGANGAR
jgi:general secretion pathway protein G